MTKLRRSAAESGARRRRSLAELLEPRILLSADLPGLSQEDALTPEPGSDGERHELLLRDESDGTTQEQHDVRRELVFVDEGVEGFEQLVEALSDRDDENTVFEIHVLREGTDGIAQIGDVLAGAGGNVDAVHILSHGTEGGVQLGNTWLTADSLGANASSLASWAGAFSSDGDLLIYGCNLAGNDAGQQLVDSIATLTGADVAASADLTGAALLGGDWDLEYAKGEVETAVAPSAALQHSFSQVLGGTAIWAENGSTTPETSEFDGSSFGLETQTTSAGGEARVIVGAASATRDEKIVVTVNESGSIDSMIWDGSTWSDPSASTYTVSDPENWSVDVAYESQSGDAIIVHNNGSGGIDYAIWDGSVWSTSQTIAFTPSGEASYMKLAASPDSDEMVLVVSDANNHDYALIWDGSSWGNATVLHDGGGATTHTDVSVAYEQQSGHAMVVWSEGGSNIHYSIWDGSSFGAEQTLDDPGGPTGNVRWTSIASDPTSDRIVVAAGTDFHTAWASVWDGTAWEPSVLLNNNTEHIDRQNIAVAFESTSGEAIAAYTDSANNAVQYRTWSSGGGWSAEMLGPTFTSTVHVDVITLDADPLSDAVMLSVVEQSREVSFAVWDGASWGTTETLETDAGTNRAQPFLFLWDQVATPTVSVSGASTVEAGSPYTLSLSASQVDFASLSWTIDWGDGVVETVGNVASVTHTYTNSGFTNNILVSASDVNGTYIVGDLLSTSFQTNSIMRFDANSGEFLQEFGSGDVDRPVDVQVGPDGRIYVTGFGSNNIYRYEADGSAGVELVSGAGLSGPSRIAFGPDGSLYVTSMLSNEVLRFDPSDGTALGVLVGTGLNEPDGITFGPDGQLYVANRGSGRIHRYDPVTGARDVSFLANTPTGYTDITFGPDGHLWATNQSSDNIERYDGTTGADLGEWTQIGAVDFAGIAFGPDGYLYMSDAMTANDKIVRYKIADGGSTSEDFILSGAEGLDQPVNIVFTPAQQVRVVTPPTANADTASVFEGASVTIDLAGNDTDPDDGLDLGSIVITSGASNGSIFVNGDGTVTYTHDGSETTADSFSYTIDDASGTTSNVAIVSITVDAVNDAPVGADQTVTIAEDGSHTFALGDFGFADPLEGDGFLEIVIGTISGGGTLTNGGAILVGGETVTAADISAGALVFTPAGNENGSGYASFTFQVRDDGGTANGGVDLDPVARTLTIDVTPVNDPPLAVDDTSTVAEGGTVRIDLAANDSDVDDGLDLNSIEILSGPAHGTLGVRADGTIDYDHDGGESSTDTFTYRIRDVAGSWSNVATVDLTITPVNDVPQASQDAAVVAEGGSVTIDLAANDSDADDGLDLASIQIVTPPGNGSITVNADGTVDYDHDGTETSTDTFTYRIRDVGGSWSNVATVDLTITPVNDPPQANPDATLVAEGDTVTIDLAANDSDADDGLDLTSIQIVTPPGNGSITVNADGTVDYDHDGSEGLLDSFTYTIRDASGQLSSETTVLIGIIPVNDLPSAADDSATVLEGGAVTIDLATNDSDADDGLDLASIQIVDAPTSGTLTVNPDGTVVYTHDGSETTTDSFTYTIRDAGGQSSNLATVDLAITPVNDAPSGSDSTITILEDTSRTLTAADFGFSDAAEGHSFVGIVITGVSGGGVLRDGATVLGAGDTVSAVSIAAGNLVYSPAAGESGAAYARIDFQVMDDGGRLNGGSDVDATPNSLTIDVTPENDAPILASAAPTLGAITEDELGNPGQTVASILGGSLSDVDPGASGGIAITRLASSNGTWQYSTNGGASWTSIGSVGSTSALLLRDADLIRFVPDGENADSASFDFRGWDRTTGVFAGTADTTTTGGTTAFSSGSNTASIVVTGVNDAPSSAGAVLAPISNDVTDPPGATISGLLSGRFSDVDTGASLSGVAVVGNGSSAGTTGEWEYSSDGGATWFAVGNVGDDSSALALSAGTRLRFTPDASFDGAAPDLIVRALDDTHAGGFSSTVGGEVRVQVDAGSNGGTSSVGGTPSTISTRITPFPIVPPPTDPLPGPDVEPGPSEDPEPGEDDPQTSDLPPTDPLPLGFIPDADDLRPTDPVGGTSSHSFTPASTAITEPRLDVQASKLRDPRLHDSRADKAETRAQNDERDGAPSFANIASELGRELDRLRRAVEYEAVVEQQVFGSSIALTAGLSIGYVVWLTRGGLLIASMVSSMPVWRLIDPVPILAGLALSQDEDDDGGESLGSILDGATTEQPPGEPGEADRGAGENGAREPGALEPI